MAGTRQVWPRVVHASCIITYRLRLAVLLYIGHVQMHKGVYKKLGSKLLFGIHSLEP